jgi:hypothetical protein
MSAEDDIFLAEGSPIADRKNPVENYLLCTIRTKYR